jgi:hypothetical protein
MSLSSLLEARLDASYALFSDLVDSLSEDDLTSKLPGLRSNTIGEQLWCVVGVRESYAKAIEAGEWQGFGCSLSRDDTKVTAKVAAALANGITKVKSATAAIEGRNDAQDDWIVALLEHEAAHQGQLIRYLYGLNLEIPQSWKDKHALD